MAQRISKKEAELKIQNTGKLFVWTNVETNEYFFSDAYQFPENMTESDDWCSCSYTFPNRAEPRKGLETGEILTLDDYLLVFKEGETELA